jgi:hypothetical protein
MMPTRSQGKVYDVLLDTYLVLTGSIFKHSKRPPVEIVQTLLNQIDDILENYSDYMLQQEDERDKPEFCPFCMTRVENDMCICPNYNHTDYINARNKINPIP